MSADLEPALARCVELLARCPPECRPHVAARLDALETLLRQVATPEPPDTERNRP